MLLAPHSLPASPCLPNPVIYGVELVLCFVAAVKSEVKNVLPAAPSFSFSVTQEALLSVPAPVLCVAQQKLEGHLASGGCCYGLAIQNPV